MKNNSFRSKNKSKPKTIFKIVPLLIMLLLVTLNLQATPISLKLLDGNSTVTTIPANAPAGYLVGTLAANLSDPTYTASYGAQLNGNQNSLCNFDNVTGKVTLIAPLTTFVEGDQFKIRGFAIEKDTANNQAGVPITADFILTVGPAVAPGPTVPTIGTTRFDVPVNAALGSVVFSLDYTSDSVIEYYEVSNGGGGDVGTEVFNCDDDTVGDVILKAYPGTWAVGQSYNVAVNAQDAEGEYNTAANDFITVNVIAAISNGVKPTFDSTNNHSVQEGAVVNGQNLGNLLATDKAVLPVIADTVVSYNLVAATLGGAFAIVNGNELQIGDETLFTDANSPLVAQVTATDSGGDVSLPFEISVTVRPAPVPLTFLNTNVNIFENSPTGFAVTNALTTTGGVGVVTLTMPSHSVFELVGDVVKVKDGSLLDYETKTQYVLNVTATDSDTLPQTDTATITINITNINEVKIGEAPGPILRQVRVTALNGDRVGLGFSHTSDDPSAPVVWSFDSPNSIYKMVNGGIVVLNAGLLVLGSADYDIVLKDQNTGYADIRTVTIEVLPAPLNLIDDHTIGSRLENVTQLIGHLVTVMQGATITANDPYYTVNGGSVQTTHAFDYEVTTSYSFDVTATLGNDTDTATITVDIMDEDDGGTVSFSQAAVTRNVDENTKGGNLPGAIETANATFSGNLQYAHDNTYLGTPFNVNWETGQVRISKSADFNFEVNDYYEVVVRATDKISGATDTVTYQITLNDLAEAGPPTISPQSFDIAEKQFLDGQPTGMFANGDGDNLVYTQPAPTWSINSATGEFTILDTAPVIDTIVFVIPVTVTNSVTGEFATADMTFKVFPEGTFDVQEIQYTEKKHHGCLVTSPEWGLIGFVMFLLALFMVPWGRLQKI